MTNIDWQSILRAPVMQEPLIQPVAVIVGVDPGVDGAIACLWGFEDGNSGFKRDQVVPMPWSKNRQIDWGAVRWVLTETQRMADARGVPCLLGVEVPFFNPTRAYMYGYQVEYAQRIWGIACGLRLPRVEVEVCHWQKAWLPAKLKKEETTKQRAVRVVKRVYGCDVPIDGQADAVCIGHHVWTNLWRNPNGLKKIQTQTEERIRGAQRTEEGAGSPAQVAPQGARHGGVAGSTSGAGTNHREGIQPASSPH